MAIGRTNKAKYDHYKAIVDEQAQAFVDSVFPDGLPEAFYEVGRTKIRKYPIVGAYCFYGFYSEDKPSRDEVARIKFAANLSFPFNIDEIRVRYERKDGKYTASGSRKYKEILSSVKMSFCADDLQERLEANRVKYILKDGDFSCQYCGKATPEKDAVHRTIISRSYQGLRKRFRYCSEECGVYDQMGHEG